MAAEVETMFSSSRIVPWHGLGTVVPEALTSLDALHTAQLDWEVVSKPIIVDGKEVEGYRANVRTSDDSVLGIVGDRYKIVQNKEAFDFTDSLIANHEMKYETAGSLKNGKTIWLLAKMPDEKILKDDLAPYIVFSNTHDGTGAIKVALTNVRVVCNNTLDIALSTAKKSFSFKHMGSMQEKLDDARRSLELAHKYIDELNKEAYKMANSTVSDTEIRGIVKQLFPTYEDMTKLQVQNAERNREAFMNCYYMDDIKDFRNTKWGIINAVSDYRDHVSPIRTTKTYRENRFLSIINGNNIMQKAQELLEAV